MRVVLDTNVVVSALLHPERTPARALETLLSQGAVLLVDDRVEEEYRSVLERPKFKAIDPVRRNALLATLQAASERVGVQAPFVGSLLDDDDRTFIEVALAGRADVLLTGNARHYPQTLGFEVLSPTALLERLEALTPP